ncbi:MAG TPA: ABC transporter permease [Terracidiphilus sp.]|nr:ABC transporter permease [Terracidiphilus sp.]
MMRDIRFAIRQLVKSPGFTLTTVATLALGIGALTTVMTWTNAVVFNPWPQVRDASSLRFLSATVLQGSGYSVHHDEVQFVRRQSRSLSDAAGFDSTTVNLDLPNTQPEAIEAGLVNSNYFQLLGVKPQAGRFFQADANDGDFGAHDEIVLSDALWRGRFGADRRVVGRVVEINRHPFTVIGVAPAGFWGIYGGMAESAWLPLSALRDLVPDAPANPLEHEGLMAVARLRPGVSDKTAAAELHILARSYAAQQKDGNLNGWTLNLDDSAHFQRGLFYGVGEMLPILAGASGLLMLLVCINIASLLGQRAAKRRREVAIRTALGAAPGRIARQVLVETGLLALLGAAAGWAMSTVLSRALLALLPNFGFPLEFNLHSDARILLFVAAAGMVATLACGIYPVRQSLKVSQREALHEGAAAVAGRSGKRWGKRILLGLQLGICFVVLVCCGLLTRSALNVFHRDIGFDRMNTLTAVMDLSRAGYAADRGRAFEMALLDRLRNAPGVESATMTTHLPMGDWGSGNTRGFSIPGYVPAKGEDMDVVTDYDGPEFFHTMRIPMQQGRDFTRDDAGTAPDVAIVNEAMARKYWPKGNALGSSIVVDKVPRTIVGVVGNYAYHSPDNTAPNPVVYLPLFQGAGGNGYVIVALRSRTTAGALATVLRQTVAGQDSTVPLENVRSLEAVTDEQYQGSRIPAELLGAYAVCSLLVAMMGLYAVMAYSVIERNREFAVRMALGSTRSGIFRLVLAGSAWIAAVGLATGGLGAVAGVRLLRSLLFGVTPFDWLSYAAAAAILLLTLFASGLIPARRAAAIEPMRALRTE